MAISKIKSGSILDATIQGSDIAPATISNSNLAPSAVGASNISPGTITNTQISPSAGITNAQLANSSVTLNCSAVSLGGSVNISVGTEWQAITVADGSTTLNAVAGKGYFLDTTDGTIDVNLPSSPSYGDTVSIIDFGGKFNVNNVTLNTFGELLDSSVGGAAGTSKFTLNTANGVYEIVYTDSNRGWILKINTTTGTTPTSIFGADLYGSTYIEATGGTITTSGDFKIHTFTGDGCFVVTGVGNPGGSGDTVSYLVVAGGGGGGRNHGASGGAGGFREGKVSSGGGTDSYCASPLDAGTGLTIAAGTTYPITVGGGGSNSTYEGTSGSNSSFSTITSTGGGYGGGRGYPGGPSAAGAPGGSGGGGGENAGGGTGNSPPVSPPQGNPGYGPGSLNGARGGSASAPGGSNSPAALPGVCSSISSIAVGYSSAAGAGGTSQGSPANPNAANRGGSGYGGHSNFGSGGSGSKGVVIIRYKFQG